jgi:hypothetical protein
MILRVEQSLSALRKMLLLCQAVQIVDYVGAKSRRSLIKD